MVSEWVLSVFEAIQIIGESININVLKIKGLNF